MTKSRRPNQIRVKRRSSDSRPSGASVASPAENYWQVRPAQLPNRLQGLTALTKPGVRGFPGVDAAQELLAHTLRKARVSGDLLDLSASGGLLASLPGVTLRAVEGSAAALTVLQEAGLDVLAAAPGDSLLERWPQRARTVALVLSGDRGNAYAHTQIAWAHAHTPPGGTLYLAGERDKGFDRYVRFAAAAYGEGETIARDGGVRVARLTRRPGPTPALPDAEQYQAFGLTVIGRPGVFSAAKPDQATALLLQYLERQEDLSLSGSKVLDLGCGTGLLGAWAARRGAQVTLLDADLQSVRSAEDTLARNGLPGTVIHSDVDSALPDLTDQPFDFILTNPPFHVGRGTVLEVAQEFIAAARRRLKPRGQVYLVCNDFLPYEAPLSQLGPLSQVVRESGFKVLRAAKQ